jgi:uncharacterized protein
MPLSIPVTLLYGGLNALLITVLGANVSRMRGTTIGPDTPLPAELVRPVRAHGNASEWVPLALLLLLTLELSGAGSRFSLHLLGGTLFLARLLHAAGVYSRSKLSVGAAGLTYLLMVVMSVWMLVRRFSG